MRFELFEESYASRSFEWTSHPLETISCRTFCTTAHPLGVADSRQDALAKSWAGWCCRFADFTFRLASTEIVSSAIVVNK